MRRLTVCVALIIAVGLVVTPADAGCMKCRVKGYVEAINDHDTDRILSYFAEKVRFVTPGEETALDRAALERMIGWDVATGVSLTYDDLAGDGDTVSGHFTERNEFYRLLGLERRTFEITLKFSGDRIEEIRLVPGDDNPSSLNEALGPFLEWAGRRHPERLQEVYSDRHPVYSAESAETWLTLLRQWRAG